MAKKSEVDTNKDLIILKSILDSKAKNEKKANKSFTDLSHKLDNLELIYQEQARMKLFNDSSFS